MVSSPWQQVGGWEWREERREERGGVTKSGDGRGGERPTERTEIENAGKFWDQNNRHSEWYFAVNLLLSFGHLLLSIREKIRWKQVEV